MNVVRVSKCEPESTLYELEEMNIVSAAKKIGRGNDSIMIQDEQGRNREVAAWNNGSYQFAWYDEKGRMVAYQENEESPKEELKWIYEEEEKK